MMDAWWAPALLMGLAFALDLVLGDPVYALHPIRLLGRLLSVLERGLRKLRLDGYVGGILLFLLLGGISLGIVSGVYWLLQRLHDVLGFLWYLYIAWSMIALRDLAKHGNAVADAARAGDLALARERVSWLVGRDTDKMDLGTCCRAAIESISENLTDGVIAPLCFFYLFGVPGLVLFKVVSTMDSMVGYKNQRYRRFGWCGARLDDVMNMAPALLTWCGMALWAFVLPGYSGRDCLRIGWTQHGILLGPNAGWSEAGAAGALQRRLVGPIWRQGQLVNEQWIGDSTHPAADQPADIQRMNVLAYAVTIQAVVIFTGSLALIGRWPLLP